MSAQSDKRPVWFSGPVLILASAILAVLIGVSTVRNLHREEVMMERFLLAEALTLIRSFEAGARTSIRTMGAELSPIDTLVEETARSETVAYIWLVDENGVVLASAGHPDTPPAYESVGDVLSAKDPLHRLTGDRNGSEVFEVAQSFDPAVEMGEQAPEMRNRWQRWCSMGPMRDRARRAASTEDTSVAACRQAIFVGLYTRDFADARSEDIRQSILQGGVLFLVGVAGFFLLSLTQRVRTARGAIQDLETYTRDVVESLPDALVTLDGNGDVMSMNAKASELFGVAEADARGRPLSHLVGPARCDVGQRIESGEEFNEHPTSCSALGDEEIPVRVSAAQLRNRDGTRIGTVMLIRDQREIQTMEEQLERSRRLASLGRMAAGIAHEIRNPLGTLRGFAQYFGNRADDDPTAGEYSRLMVEEIDRLNRAIGALLQFARPRDPEFQVIPLKHLFERVKTLTAPDVAAAGTKLEQELSDHDLTVLGDSDLLLQALLNLVHNSVSATPAGGAVTLSAERTADTVRIAVDDTGCGLSPKEREQMFEPFYTTRKAGTGLGLAVVHQIIEQHGGHIEVESIQGRGTRVTLVLPGASEGPA